MANAWPWLDKFEDNHPLFQSAWEKAHKDVDIAQFEGYTKYGDNIATIGLPGLVVYMLSKAARLFNIIVKGHTPGSETVDDTILDLATYALLSLTYRRMQGETSPSDPTQTS